MVGYQQFVGAVFEIARERGRDVSSLEDAQSVLRTAANLWTENKAQLRPLSYEETLRYLRRNA
jgi:hypothetical protein